MAGPEKTQGEASLLDVILDSVADGVFTVDPDLRITYWNRAAEEITGVPAAEALGRHCHDVFRADLCGAECPMKRAIATRRPAGPEEVEIATNGGDRLVSVTAAALQDRDGRFLGGVESFRDTSSRVEAVGEETRELERIEGLVARSEGMRRILGILPAVARADASVLIRGATGTGREAIARAIHRLSRRAEGPFVRLTGASATVELREDLHGPNASAALPPWLDEAAGGTLYLDEIADLSPVAQLRLVNLLDREDLQPLRSAEAPGRHVRVVAATREDLDLAVRGGRFREDLLYRVGVIRLDVPSLAERREDVPALVERALARLSARGGRAVVDVAPEAMRLLLGHDFPGNVRELENVVEHAYIVGTGPVLALEDLPAYLRRSPAVRPTRVEALAETENERAALVAALRRNSWNRSAAAQELGVHRSTLWRRMQRLGIPAEPGSE